MKTSPFVLCLLAAASVAGAARADVPTSIPFAGRLARDGTPLADTHSFTFELYDAQIGGTRVWQENHDNVGVQDGLVYARLGSQNGSALDATILDGAPLYLQIVMDGTYTFTPRLPIESVPYAVHAGTADELAGLRPDDLQARVQGTCPAGESIRAIAADGTVTCEPDTDTTNPGTITGVVAGNGLTGGGTSGAPSLAIDPTVVQRRVSVACPPGESIRAIADTGAVTCEPDTDTDTTYTGAGAIAITGTTIGLSTSGCGLGDVWKYNGSTWSCDPDAGGAGTITAVTAGAGLTGGGASGAVALAVDPTQVQNRVLGTCPAGQAVRSINQDGTVACEPNAPRTLLGTVMIPAAFSGTPTGWTQMSYESFDLTYAMANRLEYAKPGQAVQARVCAVYTDDGNTATSTVSFRIRLRDTPTNVVYSWSVPTTWSLAQLHHEVCGAWVPYTNLNACTAGFPNTCSMDVNQSQNRTTYVRQVYVELSGVN
jgi:hypothetical protein